MLSFVYDIADLYKTELTIPVAFKVAADNPSDLERQVRIDCRKAFYEFKLLERLLPDIAEVLGVSDDTGESPDEFEGALSRWLLEPKTGVFLGNPSARVRDELWKRATKSPKKAAPYCKYGLTRILRVFLSSAWG
jgi:CRISPR-associated protein Cas1